VEVCERNRRHRDYTRHELHEALREVVACFPVYRTYVRPQAGEVSEADARTISETIAFTDETFNGSEFRIANLLNRFPVALLWREDGS
jgi:maltooligosyltrehalose synthase